MNPQDLRVHLRKQPFVPFIVRLTDGRAFQVLHPDFMIVSRTEVVIGVAEESAGADELPYRFAFCDPLHVVSIEPIRNERRAG